MSLTQGTRLGPYEVVAPLGAGGMGEVYRAHDPKLKRDVAGKLMAARVSVAGSTFESGTPVALFPLRVAGGASNLFRPQYDVSRDGRFLVNQLVEETPITLLLNCTPPN